MELKKFEYLATIATEKTLSSAAQKLYVSQPRLSQFLQETEAEMGFKIFTRVNKELLPTTAGAILLTSVYKILSEYKETMQNLVPYSGKECGELHIGMTMERSMALLHKVYFRFKKQYPKVILSCTEDFPLRLDELTLNGRLDMIIGFPYRQRAELQYIPLHKDTMLVCMARDNPILRTAPIIYKKDSFFPLLDISCLSTLDCVQVKKHSKTRFLIDDIMATKNICSRIIIETASAHTSFNIIANSNLWTFMPLSYALANKDICYFSFADSPTWEICVILKSGRKINKIMQTVIDITTTALQEQINELQSSYMTKKLLKKQI